MEERVEEINVVFGEAIVSVGGGTVEGIGGDWWGLAGVVFVEDREGWSSERW